MVVDPSPGSAEPKPDRSQGLSQPEALRPEALRPEALRPEALRPEAIRYPPFRSHQIVCLEQGDQRLFGEVVDWIEVRQMVWVKPLLLVDWPWVEQGLGGWQGLGAFQSQGELPEAIDDLRDASHLLWAAASFRMALDTEVIPLLGFLVMREPVPGGEAIAKKLRQFMTAVWRQDLPVGAQSKGANIVKVMGRAAPHHLGIRTER